MRFRSIAAAFASCLSFVAAGANDDTLAIKALRLHVGDGRTIDNAVVLIRDGRIAGVGADVPIPAGARTIEIAGAHVTPGLIDANAIIEPSDMITRTVESQTRADRPNLLRSFMGVEDPSSLPMACDGVPICPLASTAAHEPDQEQRCLICAPAATDDSLVSGVDPRTSWTEASSEVVPHTLVIDSLDLRSPDFERLLRGGVTTVFATSDSSAVIGPQGCVLRTGGPVKDRVVVEAADVKAAFTADTYRTGVRNATPSRFAGVTTRTRRPNSRMGIAWVFRKAFYDAERFEAGEPLGGADLAPEPALRALHEIRSGRVPLRILARKQGDITAAFRLAAEFDLDFTLVDPVEAYRCLDEIKAAGVPVIFGPVFTEAPASQRFNDELRESQLSTFAKLHGSGVRAALSAQDLREEDGLVRQAMYAVRGGLDPAEAIRAVTSVPASLLGLDTEIGTIETGKRADVVVWSGDPLLPGSRAAIVLIGGQLVHEDGATASR